MTTISILPTGAISIYTDGKPVITQAEPNPNPFAQEPKLTNLLGDAIADRMKNLLRNFPGAKLIVKEAGQCGRGKTLGDVADVYGKRDTNQIILYLRREDEPIECPFCPAGVIGEESAQANAWIPSYYVYFRQEAGWTERFTPVCPDCVTMYLKKDEDGNWYLPRRN